MAKEQELVKSALELLKWKKIFCYRNNSGAIVLENKGKQRFMRFGASGSPDIICVIRGQFIGLELKAGKNKQSESQIKFQQELEKAEGKYHLIYSLEELQNIIQKYETN